MSDTARQPTCVRSCEFDLVARAAEDSDAIPVVVSTDAVVDVADGPEVLVHTPDAVDLRRAPLPIIATHAGGQVNVGIVDNLAIVGGQLRGMARFGSRPEAAGYRADVLDRIIRSVSAGYARIKAHVRSDGVLITTRWMPTHAALVAEPADIGAGFYRERTEQEPPFELQAEPAATTVLQPAAPAASKGEAMSAETIATPAGASAEPGQDFRNIDPVQEANRRREAISKMARANGVTDERTVQHWVQSGKSWDQIADDLLQIRQANSKTAATQLDMPKSDVQRYSMWRAMNAVLSGDWKHAGLELEASQAVAARTSRMHGAKGFFVPLDVQHAKREVQQRDLTVASASGGGYLVGTENMSFIDVLRNRSVALRMGATPMPGLSGNVTIPKQTAGATAYWLSTEGTAITESALTFGQLALTPKTVGAYVEVSRLLMMQSSPAAEGIVTADLARQVALAADLAVLHGSGASGQPTGITATGSIGSVTGTSLAYAGVLEFQSDVAANNVMPTRGGYVTTPAVAALLMARQRFSSTDTPLWQGNLWDGQMVGFPAMSSAQVNSATMIFGDWSQAVVGEWGVLEVSLNEQANFPMGVVGFRAFYTMDVGVRYAGAFSVATSIT
jgi:HK97 family phage major capsid protein